MSIVTKTGDEGETSLMYGRRLSKADPRVEAYGCIDELTAALGLARSGSPDKLISDEILAAQKDLIVVMGELATAPSDRNVTSRWVSTYDFGDGGPCYSGHSRSRERQIALSERLGDPWCHRAIRSS